MHRLRRFAALLQDLPPSWAARPPRVPESLWPLRRPFQQLSKQAFPRPLVSNRHPVNLRPVSKSVCIRHARPPTTPPPQNLLRAALAKAAASSPQLPFRPLPRPPLWTPPPPRPSGDCGEGVAANEEDEVVEVEGQEVGDDSYEMVEVEVSSDEAGERSRSLSL